MFVVSYSPYWNHVLEFWRRRNQPNIRFVWYEEMKEVRQLSPLAVVPKSTYNFFFLEIVIGAEIKHNLSKMIFWDAFDSVKNRKRQRHKRQSVTAN